MRRLLALAALALLLGACVSTGHDCTPTCCPSCCAARSADSEPILDGRTGPEWAAVARTADADSRQEAVEMLARLGPASCCAALRMLDSDDGGERMAGAEILRRLGRPAGTAAPRLGTLVATDRDAQVRITAARALATLGRDAAPATDPLYAAMQDERWEVRYHAARALGEVGWPAWYQIHVLDRLTHHDSDERVRGAVASARGRIARDWYRHERGIRAQ